MFAARVLLLTLLATPVLHSQAPLHFEVASVRLNRKAACQGAWDFKAERGAVITENAPLLRILSRAFNLTDDRVSGPSWLDSQCFDIKAKAPAGTSDSELMPRLQTLLRERFHLVAGIVADERNLLALVIDKDGSKLRPYGDNPPVSPAGDGKVLFMVRHLQDLCERLGKVTGRPVVDKTGLNGDYFIALTYSPTDARVADGSDSDIRSAIRDQLGLRLESQKGKVEILKIDSIDKIPTDN